MKIAQVAPLFERVPPKLYGGTERVVSYLTEELVRAGHEVTLFASGDSITAAELVPCSETALRLNPEVRDGLPYHVLMLEKVLQRADEFDVLHFHTELLHFPLVRALGHPTVTTLHGRLDQPDLVPFYNTFRDAPLASISKNQRGPIPGLNWVGNVHHGLPKNLLPFNPKGDGGYLAFLGRISPEKGPDLAIRIAVETGQTLKIAAKIADEDRAYWESDIEPLVRAHSNIEFIGEVSEKQKADVLGNARAVLFPISWREPFGLVMIEAMACGTPVIAFRRGAVAEVMEDGVTGYVVDTVEQAVEAVGKLDRLDRAAIRKTFERRFTAERMAADYVKVYRELIDGQERQIPPTDADAALRVVAFRR
ncbi:MAG TPA: glycosyltransferase family 4 protein [Arsenicitalea sp.]|jgi:glycosyltransferase involved in cell wall biosynthesis|nr:glycosyltransferase family 4 protein [Arsenicitalea sp.]